jgi:hypothetical protein
LQLGHLPIQRVLVPPHSVQVNIDLSLAMGEIVPLARSALAVSPRPSGH